MYTLDDLKKAQDTLTTWSERWENYSGNNPNKYQSDLKTARAKVRHITDYLKNNGTIPKSEQELLNDELDSHFPNAQSKEIVEYKGKKYKKVFFPEEKSRSGKTVQEWGQRWNAIDEN